MPVSGIRIVGQKIGFDFDAADFLRNRLHDDISSSIQEYKGVLDLNGSLKMCHDLFKRGWTIGQVHPEKENSRMSPTAGLLFGVCQNELSYDFDITVIRVQQYFRQNKKAVSIPFEQRKFQKSIAPIPKQFSASLDGDNLKHPLISVTR